MLTPALHQFAADQKVVYVCYGDDPSYADVARPVFRVFKATVESSSKSGKSFKFVGERRNEVRHFDYRTALCDDNARLDAIIKHMADLQRIRYAQRAAAVADQYAAGDYDIKHI